MSLHNINQNIVFDTNASNIDSFIKNVSLASNNNGENVRVGGDGRLNQIYLALWASRNELQEEKLEEVSLVCIEEPEAHLHPHQQRKLANYLSDSIKGQVIITSHSPQITCEFSPNSLIRLFSKNNSSFAASKGCSKIIDNAFKDFGYRLSIIPSEAFFADVVFLVEGPSEEIFYKTLANKLNIDLDRLNISVLMVNGVGFKVFIKILEALEIKWVMRTDNDISKIPKKELYRYSGIERGLSIYMDLNGEKEPITQGMKDLLKGFNNPKKPSQKNIEAANKLTGILEAKGIYISKKDLENDMLDSSIKNDLFKFLEESDKIKSAKKMQSKKATFMFDFLRENKECLDKLEVHQLSKPLFDCKSKVEELYK